MSILNTITYGFTRLLTKRMPSIYNSKIDKRASIGNGTQIYKSSIGKYSYAYNCKIANTEIGCFCSIAEECIIGGGSHPTSWISTSPVFYDGKNTLHTNFSNNKYSEFKKTIIGNDVWIGSKCLIKGGISIGDGAIIGMGSVVTHDIPPYEIWAGNPARFIKKRFDDATIHQLLNISWWKWDENRLREMGDYYSNPDEFFERCNSL